MYKCTTLKVDSKQITVINILQTHFELRKIKKIVKNKYLATGNARINIK